MSASYRTISFNSSCLVVYVLLQIKAPHTGCLLNMGKDLPSGKIPDGIFLQAGLAVFAFRAL